MAYIRERDQELTGYQAGEGFRESVDLQCDFVMVYGIDDTMPKRIKEYRDKGYVVHLMTGIAWGEYQDYLDGEWDGRKHWDEGQRERDLKGVNHNPTVPYMVPTIAFSEYLTEKMKVAVDAGVRAIHVEEPEFWDRSGYSDAFKREYEIFYKETYRPQHESLDVRYKSARLKAHLYCRTIERVSGALKEYAKVKYGRDIRFYVPTHSLLNYTQWKIMSPEAALINIPTVDGYIAQIWTGTSREANVYEGKYKERTFETAYLEYGVMQELVKGTNRSMWFLNDPIEDQPSYTWDNYRYHYLKTAVASLLHSDIWQYEICPWPHRVFEGVYPRYQPNIGMKDETSFACGEAKTIPQSYATLLSGMFQLFGDMDQKESSFEGTDCNVGVFMSDSGLFQRTYPDNIIEGEGIEKRLSMMKVTNTGDQINEMESAAVMKDIGEDDNLLLDFIQSAAFPNFFGMAMPLLKYGMPIKPVQLDNIRRFAGYLKEYKYLILSYEYMKPEGPDINTSILSWINSGGTLIYIGDGSDPYHSIESWWKDAGYENPAKHLFDMASMSPELSNGSYQVGKGSIVIWNMQPAKICLNKEAANVYREMVRKVLAKGGDHWEYSNHLTIHRGPYIISSVMDESVNDSPKEFEGLFADMLENNYKIITHKKLAPDEGTILFDFSKIKGQECRVIGCSARVNELTLEENGFVMMCKAAEHIKAYVRIRLPYQVVEVNAIDEEECIIPINYEWDQTTQTLLFSYDSHAKEVKLTGTYKRS